VKIAAAVTVQALLVGCISSGNGASDLHKSVLESWAGDLHVSVTDEGSARRHAARILDMPPRDVQRVMQVGSAWAIVHESPSALSQPVAKLRHGDAVRTTTEAEFMRIFRKDAMHGLSDMSEYAGEGAEFSPTWVRVEAGTITGWVPARSLIDPHSLSTSAAAVALARIESARGGATITLGELDDVAPKRAARKRSVFGRVPNYDLAGQTAGRIAMLHVVSEDADPFSPPVRGQALPDAGSDLQSLDAAVAQSVALARAAARDLGGATSPPRGIAPGGGLLASFGPSSPSDRASISVSMQLLQSIMQEYPITVTEERMLGFECLALYIGNRPPLDEAHPATCYVRYVGQRVADGSSLPYSAAGLDFVVLNEPEANARAIPGGPILVTTGMLTLLESEEELAAVLAHEVGHLEERHALAYASACGLSRLIAMRSATQLLDNDMLGQLVDGSPCIRHLSPEERAALRPYMGVMLKQMMTGHQDDFMRERLLNDVCNIIDGRGYASQSYEMLADLRALSLLRAAGYDPRALERTLGRIGPLTPAYGGVQHLAPRLRAMPDVLRVLEAGVMVPPDGYGRPSVTEDPSARAHWTRLQTELATIR
jgi:hypothetical protein